MTHEEIFNLAMDKPQECRNYGSRGKGSNYIHLIVEHGEDYVDIECWVDDRKYEDENEWGYEVDTISIEQVMVNYELIALTDTQKKAAERYVAEWLEEDAMYGGNCTDIAPISAYSFMMAGRVAAARRAAQANNQTLYD